MPKISISYVIYNKFRQKNGLYPVKLRFIYNRKPALFSTTLYAHEDDLAKVKPGDESKSREIRALSLKRKVEDVVRRPCRYLQRRLSYYENGYFFLAFKYEYSVALLMPVVSRMSLIGMSLASYMANACWIFFSSVFGRPPILPLALAAARPSMVL